MVNMVTIGAEVASAARCPMLLYTISCILRRAKRITKAVGAKITLIALGNSLCSPYIESHVRWYFCSRRTPSLTNAVILAYRRTTKDGAWLHTRRVVPRTHSSPPSQINNKLPVISCKK